MDSIGKNIGILCRQLNTYLNRSLEQTDISPTELMLLASLRNSDGRTQEDISKDFCIDKAAVARTVQSLERKELVTRKTDINDKRNKRIYVTDTVDQYNSLLATIQKQWVDTAFNNISEDDLEVFAKVLRSVVGNIRS